MRSALWEAHAGASMSDPVRPLRLLIVDNHEVVRQGLIAFLDRHEQFAVVAEAGTCAEAVSQVRTWLEKPQQAEARRT
jgi:hypothetical protein